MSTFKRIQENRVKKRLSFFKTLTLIVLLVAFIPLMYLILRQPWCSFGRVYITGAKRLERQEIMALTGLKEPVNLFLLDSREVEYILKNDLRIKEVSVYYELPNVFCIDIREEEPFLYAKSSYGFVSVSGGGIAIGAGKNIKDAQAPVLTGVLTGNSFVGDKLTGPEISFVMDFLKLLDTSGRDRIAEINIDGGRVRLLDIDGLPYIIGEMSEAGKKAAAFSAISKEVAEKNLAVEFVDLSYSQAYIKIKQQS